MLEVFVTFAVVVVVVVVFAAVVVLVVFYNTLALAQYNP